jgi:hypothetical protein
MSGDREAEESGEMSKFIRARLMGAFGSDSNQTHIRLECKPNETLIRLQCNATDSIIRVTVIGPRGRGVGGDVQTHPRATHG